MEEHIISLGYGRHTMRDLRWLGEKHVVLLTEALLLSAGQIFQINLLSRSNATLLIMILILTLPISLFHADKQQQVCNAPYQ